jgi:hypothetical protein
MPVINVLSHKGLLSLCLKGIEEVTHMRKRIMTVLLLALLIIPPLLLSGCGGDDDGSESFVLGACRLGDQDCRLQ